MSYNVKSFEVFEKQAKRLIKKYTSLKCELLQFVQDLKENPVKGTPIYLNPYEGVNFRNPVVILTNNKTASSAEDFAVSLYQQPNSKTKIKISAFAA
ncbi:MAG: hypothetical protein WAT22_05740 [Saprospiraceae bacterium]|jgi:hypothetical protein|nr:hypothetical protein [Saprospiraceae bacterium]MBK9564599.1 hypothetical protein [Saprospiraceae bacterium]